MTSESSLIHTKLLHALYQLEPQEFEQFIGELWHHCGWNTEVTQLSLDGGIDVIATRDKPYSQKHLLQVKRKGPGNLLAKPDVNKYADIGEEQNNVDIFVIITLSGFTKQARQRAEEVNIKLLDGHGLATFIIENNAVNIVEKYSTVSIRSKNKEVKSDSQNKNIVKNSNKSSNESSEPDASRFITGLKWMDDSISTELSLTARPQLDEDNLVHEDGKYTLKSPECPNCGGKDVRKHDFKQRTPKGRCPGHPDPYGTVQVRRYYCKNKNCDRTTFQPSLPFIEDNYHYIDDMRELVDVVHSVSGASGSILQLICLLYFGAMPGKHAVLDWRAVSTEEIIQNELNSNSYSGFYTYDEQQLKLADETLYRLLVYDPHYRIPIAQQLISSPTDNSVQNFLAKALEGKPCESVTTDGRSGIGKIVENELNAAHNRCLFHLIMNFENDLVKMLGRSHFSSEEKITASILGSEFKQIFETNSYATAIQRFDWLLDKIELLPSYLRKHIETVDEEREKFFGCFRDERIPRTIKSCERYFSHSQMSEMRRRSTRQRSVQSFSKQQMILRTVREGFISHNAGVTLLQDYFPEVDEKGIREMYTESKQKFLKGRELENT